MRGSAYRIATVWGIPIKLHSSLIFVLIYILVAARAQTWEDVVMIVGFQLLVFASIALHELGHSYVAIRKGCRVHEITLLFMGGAAQMERIPTRPRDEILMALAGPAVSLVLGLTGLVGGLALLRSTRLPATILLFLAAVNLMLAGFNLLPAFPMDGGRVLRAALTPRLGRLKATCIASRLGRVLAIVLGVAGIIGIIRYGFYQPPYLVLIVIGFFIFTFAGREFKMVQMEHLLQQRRMMPFDPGDERPPDETEVDPW